MSALIGYVLGRKATELEYAQPRYTSPLIAKVKPFTIKSVQGDRINFDERIELQIETPQATKIIQLEPQLGTAIVKSDSTIEYIAPSKTDTQNYQSVTIKVSSTDNQQAQTTLYFES